MEALMEGARARHDGATGREGKYLSFSLSGEEYGVPILKES